MFKKLIDFFNTDTGEIVLHCVVALVLASLVEWRLSGFWQLVADIAIVVGFIVRELWQHEWRFTEMGLQSWMEWLFPAAVVLIVYAL